MKARGLNAVGVQKEWAGAKTASDDGIWLNEARRLSREGSILLTF